MGRAACIDLDPAVMAPDDREGERRAQRVCAACHVQRECLDWAMRQEDGGRQYRAGVYGGLTAGERARLAAHLRTTALPVPGCDGNRHHEEEEQQ